MDDSIRDQPMEARCFEVEYNTNSAIELQTVLTKRADGVGATLPPARLILNAV